MSGHWREDGRVLCGAVSGEMAPSFDAIGCRACWDVIMAKEALDQGLPWPNPEDRFAIVTFKRSATVGVGYVAATFWAPEGKGYVTDIDRAGHYTLEQARDICRPSGGECVMLKVPDLDHHARRFLHIDDVKKLIVPLPTIDELHPDGKCTCAGEGYCEYCRTHCDDCGARMPCLTHLTYLDDSVALSNKKCRNYYVGRGPEGRRLARECCPEGRCWYDEQKKRRGDGLPALTTEAWNTMIKAGG